MRIPRFWHVGLIALTAALLLAMRADAQQCAPYETIQGALARDFAEQLHYTATMGEDNAIEIWTNPETGTFTLLVRPPKDPSQACLIASGRGWRESNRPKYIPGKGA